MYDGSAPQPLTLNEEKLAHIRALAELSRKEGVKISVSENHIGIDPAWSPPSEQSLAKSQPLIIALSEALQTFGNALVKQSHHTAG